jgi:pyruvate kinase
MSQNFAHEIESIISQLQPIRLEVLQAEKHFREELDHVHLGNLQSARNLVHYVSLRRHDIRGLQEDLVRLAATQASASKALCDEAQRLVQEMKLRRAIHCNRRR